MLKGILPIVIAPFDEAGHLDEESLRHVVRFELEVDIQGIGVGGFATEAYKLTDKERLRCAEIVTEEVNGRVPIIIGIAPGSTEAALEQVEIYSQLQPAALMTLPPSTMDNGELALVEHYVAMGRASDVPIMIQQSPHIPAFRHTGLSTQALSEIANSASNVRYFKIEGPGAPERIAALHSRLSNQVALFGGGGGITLPAELRAGASGLLPGVGFNEYFVDIWASWLADDHEKVESILDSVQPLVNAISGNGHEFSLHARKHLLKRRGIIKHATVRRPTVLVNQEHISALCELVDSMGFRLSMK